MSASPPTSRAATHRTRAAQAATGSPPPPAVSAAAPTRPLSRRLNAGLPPPHHHAPAQAHRADLHVLDARLLPQLHHPLDRVALIEARDALREEPPRVRPLARHQPPKRGQPHMRVEAPRPPPHRVSWHGELERRHPPTGLHHARQLPHRGARILHVAQQVSERKVVELLVIERQPLGFPLHERHLRGEYGVGGDPRPRPPKHLRALIDPHHRASVATHERLRHHAGAGRHVKHAILRARPHLPHHRPPPAGVLAKAECRRHAIVMTRERREELERLALQRAIALTGRPCPRFAMGTSESIIPIRHARLFPAARLSQPRGGRARTLVGGVPRSPPTAALTPTIATRTARYGRRCRTTSHPRP